MIWVKALHVLAVFMWIGTLLSLTRFMGYHPKESADTQMQLSKLYRRMYNLIERPSMVVAVLTGSLLWYNLDLSYKPGWFHMKLTFVAALFICDLYCGRWINQLNVEPIFGRGVKFKILHGMTGLMLIGLLIGTLVVRDKKGEILNSYKKEQSIACLEK